MLDTGDRAVVRALCTALLADEDSASGPEGLVSEGRLAAGAVESVERGLAMLPEPSRVKVVRLLRIIDSPIVSLLWSGSRRRFSRMSVGDAERHLRRLSTSKVHVIRRTFEVLKRLILLRIYGSEEAQAAIWGDMGYLKVAASADAARLSVSVCPRSCQTLVIGSGAGGAVVASRLAEMGQDVVLLEKGAEVQPSEMTGIENEAMDRMFEQAGLLTTSDGAISLFAGSCLGGGTTVNWSASFRIPDAVRHEWSVGHGVDWIGSQALDEAYHAVEERTNVGSDQSGHNAQNKALQRGCRALNMPFGDVPRNTRGCELAAARDCGRCGLGCAHGRKMGATTTFLRDLKARGGTIVSNASVEKILLRGGRVVGAQYQIAGAAGTTVGTIDADRVILAAGALNSPAVLMRSGIHHERLGRNLRLHPTVGVAGFYAEKMRAWEGPIMSTFSDAYAEVDGSYGVRIETPPIYPGLLASALPWNGARNHKSDLAALEHIAAFIVLTRDRSQGTVTLGRDGSPDITYQIGDADLAMLLTGVIEAARLHVSAGADQVLFPHSLRKVISSDAGDRVADLGRDIFTWGWRPGLYPLFSAHQMGTCAMGGDARTHPTDPEGRFRGIEGLYVADASVFPSSSGVNPALTIQALSYAIAAQIV